MNQFIYLILLPVVLGAWRISIGGKNQLTIRQHAKSYTFHTTPATWDEAKNICEKEGGRLAVVTSNSAENKMLKAWHQSGPVVNPTYGFASQAFIGIRLTTEGHWEDIDGRSPTYVNWSQDWVGAKQPDNPKHQKCGSLLKKGGMDDVQCHYKLAFFCEI